MFESESLNILTSSNNLSDRLNGVLLGSQPAYGLCNGNASAERAAVGAIAAPTLSGSSLSVGGKTLIVGGQTSIAEINEVNSLLSQSMYDRDQITGGRIYNNDYYSSSVSTSAHESIGLDRGDFITNAIGIGRVIHRSDATVKGWVGYTYNGVRDADDYYSFEVGKGGRINLGLTGLSRDVGLALYNSAGTRVAFSDKGSNQSESISLDLDAGSYVARVYSYAQAPWSHGATSYTLNINRSADALEAYWQSMLTDSSIRNAALNAIQTDSSLSRADVIGILRSAADGGSVSGAELTDLRNFYNNAINTVKEPLGNERSWRAPGLDLCLLNILNADQA